MKKWTKEFSKMKSQNLFLFEHVTRTYVHSGCKCGVFCVLNTPTLVVQCTIGPSIKYVTNWRKKGGGGSMSKTPPLIKGQPKKFPWNCALQVLCIPRGRKFLKCSTPGNFFRQILPLKETPILWSAIHGHFMIEI